MSTMAGTVLDESQLKAKQDIKDALKEYELQKFMAAMEQ